MPTFTAGKADQPLMIRNGFTLVELMIVIAVMALMAGVVVVTAGPSDQASASATRFASRVAAARDEAIVGGRPISVWVAPSGYGFERHEQGAWTPMAARPFQGDNWAPGTTVALPGAAAARARVRFDSLGLPEGPASFALTKDGRVTRVEVAANGDVSVG